MDELIGLSIACLIGAVFLRAAAKWVASLDVPFGKAYTTVFIAWLIGLLVHIVGVESPLLSSAICLPVQAGVICWRLSVTFGKALLISLVMMVISIVVVGIAVLIVLGMLSLASLL
ncbi:MAG: hypothetical protein ACYTBX_01750 [Planctomycetota bacterium]|jgi:hypothetical protein